MEIGFCGFYYFIQVILFYAIEIVSPFSKSIALIISTFFFIRLGVFVLNKIINYECTLSNKNAQADFVNERFILQFRNVLFCGLYIPHSSPCWGGMRDVFKAKINKLFFFFISHEESFTTELNCRMAVETKHIGHRLIGNAAIYDVNALEKRFVFTASLLPTLISQGYSITQSSIC